MIRLNDKALGCIVVEEAAEEEEEIVSCLHILVEEAKTKPYHILERMTTIAHKL